MPRRPNGGSYALSSEQERRQAHLTPGVHPNQPTGFKLYISGPITGIENDNRHAFAATAERLRRVGYQVINPHDIGAQSGYREGLRWSDYLRADLAYILTQGVDGIATIAGWYKSPGAIFECEVALKLDLPVGPESFWLSTKKEN